MQSISARLRRPAIALVLTGVLSLGAWVGTGVAAPKGRPAPPRHGPPLPAFIVAPPEKAVPDGSGHVPVDLDMLADVLGLTGGRKQAFIERSLRAGAQEVRLPAVEANLDPHPTPELD